MAGNPSEPDRELSRFSFFNGYSPVPAGRLFGQSYKGDINLNDPFGAGLDVGIAAFPLLANVHRRAGDKAGFLPAGILADLAPVGRHAQGALLDDDAALQAGFVAAVHGIEARRRDFHGFAAVRLFSVGGAVLSSPI